VSTTIIIVRRWIPEESQSKQISKSVSSCTSMIHFRSTHGIFHRSKGERRFFVVHSIDLNSHAPIMSKKHYDPLAMGEYTEKEL
jgi:exoribonuclease II